ncbi:MAG TPA: SCP2 sterol-binding domain-containing protein [Lysobacter sp.]|jgi:predicted lipid carrier protein YhbT/chorismate mutase|nr:SCP2 sterol-binding domain-containing protein [Lysobacter sp.]
MPDPLALAWVRRAIDGVDDAMLVLLAGRGRLARHAARIKQDTGVPGRDIGREARVHARAQWLASRIGLPIETAQAMTCIAIDHACRQQGLAPDLDQGPLPAIDRIIAPAMYDTSAHNASSPRHASLLRLIPPPSRLAPLLRVVPMAAQRRLLERAMQRVLAAPLADGTLDFMQGRRLGIEVTDLGLRWVIEQHGSRLTVTDEAPEASVRGTATDLLLLASRLEDADTLFFQRRLVLTGDTELGLTARNLLERLPWESVPLGLRIGLNRGARFARAARAAHAAGRGRA